MGAALHTALIWAEALAMLVAAGGILTVFVLEMLGFDDADREPPVVNRQDWSL